jgi:UDP-GlcNAc:undecaprenyl-phosphate/decaprenyl-phosphate GlcNAc-1-phosphate transferase
MNTYLTLFVVALVSSIVLTPGIRRLAQRLGWLDVPKDQRRLHLSPVPRLGGVAIFLSVLLALIPLTFLDNLVTATLRANVPALKAVMVSATLVFLFGVYDDVKGTSAKWKFLALAVAGVVLYLMGGRITAISIPFVGSIRVPEILGLALTIFWVVAISNAFNLIDGLDGLAAGAALFATLVMLVVSFLQGNSAVTVLTLIIAGSLIGFLRYNFNPASIFLGDSGALFLGFTLAALSLVSAQKASTAVAVAIPMMAFGLPIIDTSFTVMRRFISGHPLFEGDREHIHHKLLERGWSQRHVVFVLYGVCALFSLLGLLSVREGGGGRITAVVLIVLGAAVIFVAGRLRYLEADEVKAGIKRNLGDRRLRIANHMRVRRAGRMLAEANTLETIFTAVGELLKSAEFVYVAIELGCLNDGPKNERVLGREINKGALRGAKMRDGLICWDWERGDVEGFEVVNSDLFWTVRLPLSTNDGSLGSITFFREFGSDELLLDINYLSSLFQRELTSAVDRVLAHDSQQSLGRRIANLSGERRVPVLSNAKL